MIKKIYNLITKNKITTLAGSVAFYLIINGGSLLFLFVIISSRFSNSFNELIIKNITDGKLKELIIYFFDYQNSIPYSLFLVITSIYSASSLYYHLTSSIDLLLKKEYKLTISKRVLAIIMTIIYIVLINFISIIATELFLFLNIYFKVLSILVILIIYILSLYLINSTTMRNFNIKKTYKGIIFTVIYSAIFTIGFFIYVSIFSNFKIVYGILSFVIILFFYIYVICIGILIGIFINHNDLSLKDLRNNS